MKPCPQCGAELGEGAKACASCGWKKGMSKVLLVFLVLVGGFLLICGGVAVWGGLKVKKLFEVFQAEGTPPLILTYRIAVLKYAEKNGKLPETIQEALQATGEKVDLPPGAQEDGQRGAIDSWLREVRYTRGEDGAFEIRSGGPDRQMDTADDLVEKGTMGEDVEPLRDELRRREREFKRKSREAIGADPDVDFGEGDGEGK